jgi:hypothetical protein
MAGFLEFLLLGVAQPGYQIDACDIVMGYCLFESFAELSFAQIRFGEAFFIEGNSKLPLGGQRSTFLYVRTVALVGN